MHKSVVGYDEMVNAKILNHSYGQNHTAATVILSTPYAPVYNSVITMRETEEKIKNILNKVRPYIQKHGGDVFLLEIKDATAILKIEGACVGCPLADLTYNKVIRAMITEDVPEVTDIVFQ